MATEINKNFQNIINRDRTKRQKEQRTVSKRGSTEESKKKIYLEDHIADLRKGSKCDKCSKVCFIKFITTDMIDMEIALRRSEKKTVQKNIRSIQYHKIGHFIDLRYSEFGDNLNQNMHSNDLYIVHIIPKGAKLKERKFMRAKIKDRKICFNKGASYDDPGAPYDKSLVDRQLHQSQIIMNKGKASYLFIIIHIL